MPALPGIMSVTIAWSAYAGAQAYVLGVNEGQSRAAGPQFVQETYYPGDPNYNSASRVLIGMRDCQWYYYEVVAVSSTGQFILLESGTFLTVRPARNLSALITDSIRLSWSAPCGSLHQEQWVDIGHSPGSNDVAAFKVSNSATNFTVPMSLPAGTYYFRVNNRYGYTWFPSEDKQFTIAAPTRKLVVSVSPAGAGTTSPSGTTTWNLNTPVTVTATPNTGYKFGSWSGSATGVDPIITIVMDSDKSLVANFAVMPQRVPATNLVCSS